jgi:Family of unknown function (DUF6599)
MIRSLIAILGLVPLTLAAQDDAALVNALANTPEVRITSGVDRYEGPRLEEIFFDDTATVEDYGVRGVAEFAVEVAGVPVAVRITEMIDSAAAFGLFTYAREPDRTGYAPAVVGTEGYAEPGRLVFWQAAFVVELEGPPEASLTVGQALSATITAPSRKPPVSVSLPARGLVPDSERYIVSASFVGERLGLDPEVLGFDKDVEMATAAYQEGPARATLALLSYPTPQLARLHSEAWLSAVPDPGPTRRSGLLFGIVTSTNSPDFSETILSELSSQFDITWEEPPRDPLTIQRIILTAFTWIGIAMGFTVFAGLGVGGLRIYMKTRYGHGLFGDVEPPGFLQLKLDQPVNNASDDSGSSPGAP